MNLSPRMKKLLTVGMVFVMALALTGCTVPTNADGSVKLVTDATTFSDMTDESWFSAIFVYPIAWVINQLSKNIGVGGAIILVTIVVNGLIALITLKSTIATQQMQMIQPELEKIQRKYEGRDDESSKMRQAAEMQALYQKYDINPVSALLTQFIQFPLIMAMYMAVRRSEAVQTGIFMGIDLQNTPLSGMQALFKGDMAGLSYLILFIFMGLCQFGSMMLPQYLQKKKAKQEAEKHHRKPVESSSKQAQMMQYYMMGMILIFGLMWPTAMSLYWAINSLVNIVKTLAVQSLIDKKQKEGK